ncbi:MAG: acyl-CoA dehydrogenase family protein [Solirubrobacteraceae bacterium]
MSDAELAGEAARGILSRPTAPDDPWAPVREGGWIGIGVPEDEGGQGGTLVEAAAVARAAGSAASAAPVVESMLVGLMVAACQGAHDLLPDLASGRIRATLVPRVVRSDRTGCVVDRVVAPWARHATHVVLIASLAEGGLGLVVMRHEDLELVEGTTVAGDPLDALRFADNQLPATVHDLHLPIRVLVDACAVLTAARMAGAMRAVADASVEHARHRRQFGRPIGAFQALAHDLVRQEADVALTEAALAAATGTVRDGSSRLAGCARVVASTRTPGVVRVAHQVHGAIGVTREHALHRHTLRLTSWRDAFGSTRWWTERVGARALVTDDWWDTLAPAA